MSDSGDGFYHAIEPFDRFDEVVDPARYRPVPADWLVGAADVVDSTGAIAAGRYKAVNTAGAGVIAAVLNARGRKTFPFTFGGDGAAFAIPEASRAPVEVALAAMRRWSAEEIGLSLRAALVPVADIRRAGHEVAVARFRASPHCDYAMFAGGGIAWAEAQMKAGAYAIAPAQPGARPELDGLSCRFKPLVARRGEIVSLLVAPAPAAVPAAFAALVRHILETVGTEDDRQGHPVPAEGPRFVWPPQGLALEAHAMRFGPLWVRRAAVLVNAFIPWALSLTRQQVRNFDPASYRITATRNTDFRKFDDGLKLTVDCDAAAIARLERLLAEAQTAGIADYGLHRQDSALMTCIVPSPFLTDHMHFVDGAAGGYARAAEMLKAAVERRRAAGTAEVRTIRNRAL